MPLDVSPASVTDLTGDASSTGPTTVRADPADAYGSSTIAFGTEVVKVAPPRSNHFTRLDGWDYECGSTAHTVTAMIVVAQAKVAAVCAAGQAVIKLDSNPTAPDGSILAAGDFIAVKDEAGIVGVYKVASVSGLSVTITVSVGSADSNGFTYAVPTGRVVWFFGAPGASGDHPKRCFRMPASLSSSWRPPLGICAPAVGQPIALHSNNATATGYLAGPYFSHVKL